MDTVCVPPENGSSQLPAPAEGRPISHRPFHSLFAPPPAMGRQGWSLTQFSKWQNGLLDRALGSDREPRVLSTDPPQAHL